MGDTLIESGRGSPNLGDYRWERHFVDISTDSNGTGSTTLSYDQPYADGSTVSVHVTGDADGDWYVSAHGGSQATINVTASATTSGTVSAMVLVVGADR